jgi:ATP adenylyltransferase
MDYLWTPWRYQYVTKAEDAGVCVFCSAAQSEDDAQTLVVHRGTHNLVILNRYPYCSGHVMVVPYEHVATLEKLSDEALGELFRLARDCETHLRAAYRPDGLNLGMNLGKSAGAGIADHLHLHVLPRWAGDTNFMTVVGETRVVPESLDVTWAKLRSAFAGGPAPSRDR